MAGYVNLSSMPKAKTERVVSFENLAGGLNLQELDYRIDNNETPEMKNLLWREGVLSCRDGQVWVNGTAGEDLHAAYRELWNGRMFTHSGHSIFAVDPETGDRLLLYTGANMDTGGTFFPYADKLYYKTKDYYVEISYVAEESEPTDITFIDDDGDVTIEVEEGAEIYAVDDNGNVTLVVSAFSDVNLLAEEVSKGNVIVTASSASGDIEYNFHAQDVVGYVPVTYINCSPLNGSGTVYQPENRISDKKTLWYTAAYTLTNTVSGDFDVAIEESYFRMSITDAGTYEFDYDGSSWTLNGVVVDPLDFGITIGGTPVMGNYILVTLSYVNVYHLPVKDIEVTKVVVDGAELDSSEYTVDSANGLVVFNTGPVLSYPEINNTVQITYSKKNDLANKNIMDCPYAAVYGGTGALCIVVAGCEDQPNAYFWNGQTSIAMDPGYFPMTQYQLAGDGYDPISGFGKQQGYLIIFKNSSIGRTSMNTETVDERLTIDLPYTAINAKIGCNLPGTIQLIENNLVWCNTDRGVHFLANTSSAYENNVICISEKVNESSDNWTMGLLYDVRNVGADIVASHDDEKRYWLVVDGHVWLWDYYISNYKNPSWFYFDNVYGRAFIQAHDDVWHFDSKSRLTHFERVYYDYDPSENGKGAIDKVFRFAVQYFGTYDNLKNVNSVIINTRSDTNSIIDLRYMTDYEDRLDLTPLRSLAWLLVPRNLDYRMLKGSGFAHVFRRKPHCRRVQYFTMRLENNMPSMDMSIVSAQIYYTYQGRQR